MDEPKIYAAQEPGKLNPLWVLLALAVAGLAIFAIWHSTRSSTKQPVQAAAAQPKAEEKVQVEPVATPAEVETEPTPAPVAVAPSAPVRRVPAVQAIEPPPPVVKTTPDITIDGEVFIVTQGGQSIKLALVEIGLIPMELLEPYIQQKKKESDEGYARLAPQVEAAKQKADRLKLKSQQAYDAWNKFLLSRVGSFSQISDARDKADKASSDASAAYFDLSCEQDSFRITSFYFRSLPKPKRTTKTNSDGKFHIVAPKTGLFALATKASRLAGDSHEFYFWLLKIDPAAGANQTIMLSNDNLTSSNAPESLIHTTSSNLLELKSLIHSEE